MKKNLRWGFIALGAAVVAIVTGAITPWATWLNNSLTPERHYGELAATLILLCIATAFYAVWQMLTEDGRIRLVVSGIFVMLGTVVTHMVYTQDGSVNEWVTITILSLLTAVCGIAALIGPTRLFHLVGLADNETATDE